MGEPTNATDAVQRVREAMTRFDLWPAESVIIGPHAAHPSDTPAVTLADLRALLARLADVEAENADLWTELNLCRQMCRDSQPARLSGDAHG